MYKMIVVDLDGTLLNDYKKVSKENLRAIKRAYDEKGVMTVIATGRPLEYAKRISNMCNNNLGNYIIACNGGLIQDISTGEFIHKISLSNEEVLKIRRIFLEENVDMMMLYTDEEMIIESKNISEIFEAEIKLNNDKIEIKNIEKEINTNKNILKTLCLLIGDEKKLENVIKKLESIEDIETSGICDYIYINNDKTYKSKYIDIVKKSVTKKNAINILANKLGINKNEIIVMGDEKNDIPMFEGVGLSIAMENAVDKVKEKADYITSSNNNDGVAKAINKFIFNINE